MLARWIGTGIIAALLAPATIASAQTDVPDLKGAGAARPRSSPLPRSPST